MAIITLEEISNGRLSNQQITGTSFTSVKEIVGWMGAMQAQDYQMVKWAIGLRLPGSTDESVEQAIGNADIIRTHVLRPTWHFVSSDDVHWLLELTAPRLLKGLSRRQKELELDEKTLRKTTAIIEKILQGKQLTRQEIMSELENWGVRAADSRSYHIMFYAELIGLVCNGSRREKQFTYALLDERVQRKKTYKKNEALAELTVRYFMSHGPASLPDFVWWSGLTAADAKIGLETAKSVLTCEKFQGKEYWYQNTEGINAKSDEGTYLLPAFDEFIVSYKDRSAPLEDIHTGSAITKNGIFKPVIVKNGKVIGSWSRTIKKDRVIVKPVYFNQFMKLSEGTVRNAAKPFENFLNTESEIICVN